MEFVKYQHIEKYGNVEVEGITDGECLVFPKIDGTNGSVWLKNGKVAAGSRKRDLSLEGEKDNAGFYEWVKTQSNIEALLKDNPDFRLFGEWLVPHSLKTYRDDAWRRFYVFDVLDKDGYLHYDKYKPILDKYKLDYITPLIRVTNASDETLKNCLKKNTFLIKENSGEGEGIVIKNYDYKNKYGRICWAKIVTNEFKDSHHREMGPTEIKEKLKGEEKFVIDKCTKSLCEKVKAKIELEEQGWTSSYIPKLLGIVYHDLVTEELWSFIKKNKGVVIDFKRLERLVNIEIKKHLPDVF